MYVDTYQARALSNLVGEIDMLFPQKEVKDCQLRPPAIHFHERRRGFWDWIVGPSVVHHHYGEGKSGRNDREAQIVLTVVAGIGLIVLSAVLGSQYGKLNMYKSAMDHVAEVKHVEGSNESVKSLRGRAKILLKSMQYEEKKSFYLKVALFAEGALFVTAGILNAPAVMAVAAVGAFVLTTITVFNWSAGKALHKRRIEDIQQVAAEAWALSRPAPLVLCQYKKTDMQRKI